MTYFVCAVLSVALLFYLETGRCVSTLNSRKIICSTQSYNFVFIILLLYWTFIIGFQYDVGADFHAYRIIFTYGVFHRPYEFLFHYFVLFLSQNNIHYRFGFVFIALLQFICFILFLKKIKLSYNYLFIYLFFFVSTAFYNQPNIIRQFVSVYLFLLASWFIYKRRPICYVALIMIASFFHTSALALLPVYFLTYFKLSQRFLCFLLLFLFLLSLFSLDNFVSMIIPLFGAYERFLGHAWAEEEIPIMSRLTRYIYIPFYLLSLLSYKKLNDKDKFFFQAGFISFSIIIFSLASRVLTRFSVYFWIPALFPLYYLCLFLFSDDGVAKRDKKIILFSFFFANLIMFLGRIIFLYEYNSIFSNEITHVVFGLFN